MRTLGGFCIALLCAGGVYAQRGAGAGSRGTGAGSPGRASHGATVPRWPYSGYGYSEGRFHGPYAYPVFVGGFYDSYGSYGYAPYGYGDQGAIAQQPVTVVNQQPQTPPSVSPIIINIGVPPGQPGPSGPPASSYQEPPQQPDNNAPAESAHYLIALKDHTIYSAVAYWVDGSTLHYFTSGNTHNQISLSLVDRDLTQRLNQGGGLEVKLPPAK